MLLCALATLSKWKEQKDSGPSHSPEHTMQRLMGNCRKGKGSPRPRGAELLLLNPCSAAFQDPLLMAICCQLWKAQPHVLHAQRAYVAGAQACGLGESCSPFK